MNYSEKARTIYQVSCCALKIRLGPHMHACPVEHELQWHKLFAWLERCSYCASLLLINEIAPTPTIIMWSLNSLQLDSTWRSLYILLVSCRMIQCHGLIINLLSYLIATSN